MNKQHEIKKRLALLKLSEHPMTEKEVKDIREFINLNFEVLPMRSIIKDLIYEIWKDCKDKDELREVMRLNKHLFEEDLEYARGVFKNLKS